MSSKVKLYWYRHNEGNGNFGDALNPYIIEKLTGKDPLFVDIYYFGLKPVVFLKTLLYNFLNSKISLILLVKYFIYHFISKPKILVAIGSILQLVKSENIIVWGAGVIAQDVTKFANADFRAVRGKLTQDVIHKQGYLPPKVIGDPSILLPLIVQPEKKKKYKIGIIPHFIHFKEVLCFKNSEILIINLLDPIDIVIAAICSCENTFSTSLHGLIVSHVYGVPSIWVNSQQKKLDGDDIKFHDYFSSVDLKTYKPLDMSQFLNNSFQTDYLLGLFDCYESLPDYRNMVKIQTDLLQSFPFKMKEEFMNLIYGK